MEGELINNFVITHSQMSASVFNRRINSDKNSDVDDSVSQTTSTVSRRLTRKPDERSNSKRSFSRTNSEKSPQTMDIGRFYVKMNKNTESANHRFISRKQHLFGDTLIDDPNPEKKRDATPVPGHIRRKKEEGMEAIRT